MGADITEDFIEVMVFVRVMSGYHLVFSIDQQKLFAAVQNPRCPDAASGDKIAIDALMDQFSVRNIPFLHRNTHFIENGDSSYDRHRWKDKRAFGYFQDGAITEREQTTGRVPFGYETILQIFVDPVIQDWQRE